MNSLRALLFCAIVLFLLGSRSLHAQIQQGVVASGTVLASRSPTVSYGSCNYTNFLVERSYSSFEQSASGTIIIGINAEYLCLQSDGNEISYMFDGAARLIFSNSKSGQIWFSNADGLIPLSLAAVRFENFSQSWVSSANSLYVKFTIIFPFASVPIAAVYYK
jgi:hypothetical protein